MSQTLVSGLVAGSIYGILALGLVMVYRGSKVLHFAQVEVGSFSLFVAWTVVDDWGLPWLAGAAAAVATAIGLSLAFERFVVRPMSGAARVPVAVATIGLLLLLIAVELRVWGPSPKFLRGPIQGDGPTIGGYVVSWTELLAFVAAGAVAFGINAFLRRTDFGLGVLAAAEDPDAVRMMGIRLSRVSAFTWGTAGLLGALGVLFVEPTVGAFAPGVFSAGATALFVPALAAALLGGLQSLPRAFAGGLAVGVVEASVRRLFLTSSVPGAPAVAVFVIIVGVLLWRPRFLRLATA
jgi:branched-chain amino acid transport system permease protein